MVKKRLPVPHTHTHTNKHTLLYLKLHRQPQSSWHAFGLSARCEPLPTQQRLMWAWIVSRMKTAGWCKRGWWKKYIPAERLCCCHEIPTTKIFYLAATCWDHVAYFGICFEKLQAVVYKHSFFPKLQGTQDRTENSLKGCKCNCRRDMHKSWLCPIWIMHYQLLRSVEISKFRKGITPTL